MILIYIFIIVFILILDFIWLFLNSTNYNSLIEKVQKTPLSINFIGAILSYLTLICALFFFSIPLIELKLKNNKNLFILCLLYGGGLGLLLYGMFNATNYGIFTNYNYKIALLDTFWGFIIFTISSYLFFLIKHIFNIISI
jgi:uncharacterized membrane protein